MAEETKITSCAQITITDLTDTATYIYYASSSDGANPSLESEGQDYIGIYSGPALDRQPNPGTSEYANIQKDIVWSKYTGSDAVNISITPASLTFNRSTPNEMQVCKVEVTKGDISIPPSEFQFEIETRDLITVTKAQDVLDQVTYGTPDEDGLWEWGGSQEQEYTAFSILHDSHEAEAFAPGTYEFSLANPREPGACYVRVEYPIGSGNIHEKLVSWTMIDNGEDATKDGVQPEEPITVYCYIEKKDFETMLKTPPAIHADWGKDYHDGKYLDYGIGENQFPYDTSKWSLEKSEPVSEDYPGIFSCSGKKRFTYSKGQLVKAEVTWQDPVLIEAYADGFDPVQYATFLTLANGKSQGALTAKNGDYYLNATYINTGALRVVSGGWTEGEAGDSDLIFAAGVDGNKNILVRLAGWTVDKDGLYFGSKVCGFGSPYATMRNLTKKSLSGGDQSKVLLYGHNEIIPIEETEYPNFCVLQDGSMVAQYGKISGWDIGPRGLYHDGRESGRGLYGIGSPSITDYKGGYGDTDYLWKHSPFTDSLQRMAFYAFNNDDLQEYIDDPMVFPNFCVLEDGSLFANNAKITGNITATTLTANDSGKIGGWIINADGLRSANDEVGLISGGDSEERALRIYAGKEEEKTEQRIIEWNGREADTGETETVLTSSGGVTITNGWKRLSSYSGESREILDEYFGGYYSLDGIHQFEINESNFITESLEEGNITYYNAYLLDGGYPLVVFVSEALIDIELSFPSYSDPQMVVTFSDSGIWFLNTNISKKLYGINPAKKLATKEKLVGTGLRPFMVYNTGELVSTQGEIGNWLIDKNSLTSKKQEKRQQAKGTVTGETVIIRLSADPGAVVGTTVTFKQSGSGQGQTFSVIPFPQAPFESVTLSLPAMPYSSDNTIPIAIYGVKKLSFDEYTIVTLLRGGPNETEQNGIVCYWNDECNECDHLLIYTYYSYSPFTLVQDEETSRHFPTFDGSVRWRVNYNYQIQSTFAIMASEIRELPSSAQPGEFVPVAITSCKEYPALGNFVVGADGTFIAKNAWVSGEFQAQIGQRDYGLNYLTLGEGEFLLETEDSTRGAEGATGFRLVIIGGTVGKPRLQLVRTKIVNGKKIDQSEKYTFSLT